MPRPSQEAKILEAALTCFAEKGYDATRIKDIAERAGVTEGALYRHYVSKEEVAQKLYEQHLGDFTVQLQNCLQQDEPPVEARLKRVAQFMLDSFRANPTVFTFVVLRQPTFMPNLPPGTRYPIELIEVVIKEGQQAGTIRDGQTNLLAAIYLGCILRPIILSQLASPGAFELLSETKHDPIILDACWKAIAR